MPTLEYYAKIIKEIEREHAQYTALKASRNRVKYKDLEPTSELRVRKALDDLLKSINDYLLAVKQQRDSDPEVLGLNAATPTAASSHAQIISALPQKQKISEQDYELIAKHSFLLQAFCRIQKEKLNLELDMNQAANLKRCAVQTKIETFRDTPPLSEALTPQLLQTIDITTRKIDALTSVIKGYQLQEEIYKAQIESIILHKLTPLGAQLRDLDQKLRKIIGPKDEKAEIPVAKFKVLSPEYSAPSDNETISDFLELQQSMMGGHQGPNLGFSSSYGSSSTPAQMLTRSEIYRNNLTSMPDEQLLLELSTVTAQNQVAATDETREQLEVIQNCLVSRGYM